MGMDKVILRAFLSTLAAIAILFVFMFGMLVTFYPSTMMELTYNMGMDSASVHFARRAYKSSGDIYYIAYATEVAIGMDSNAKIESCGEKFISDDEFAEYCVAKDEKYEGVTTLSYQQYIYSRVCVAKYERGKAQEAVALAFEINTQTFVRSNAAVAVLYTAMQENDVETVETIKTELQDIKAAATLSETDEAYLEQMLQFIDEMGQSEE